MPLFTLFQERNLLWFLLLPWENCTSYSSVSLNIPSTDTALPDCRIAALAFATRKEKCSLQNLNAILKRIFEG